MITSLSMVSAADTACLRIFFSVSGTDLLNGRLKQVGISSTKLWMGLFVTKSRSYYGIGRILEQVLIARVHLHWTFVD